MIRRAKASDFDAILELGRRAHAKSQYAKHFVCVRGARDMLRACTLAKDKCVLVSGDPLTGFLIGSIDPYWFLQDVKVASDLMFYAEHPGHGRQLLKAFVGWARAQGANELELGISVGGEIAARTESLYSRLGLTKVGAVMRKSL